MEGATVPRRLDQSAENETEMERCLVQEGRNNHLGGIDICATTLVNLAEAGPAAYLLYLCLRYDAKWLLSGEF